MVTELLDVTVLDVVRAIRAISVSPAWEGIQTTVRRRRAWARVHEIEGAKRLATVWDGDPLIASLLLHNHFRVLTDTSSRVAALRSLGAQHEICVVNTSLEAREAGRAGIFEMVEQITDTGATSCFAFAHVHPMDLMGDGLDKLLEETSWSTDLNGTLCLHVPIWTFNKPASRGEPIARENLPETIGITLAAHGFKLLHVGHYTREIDASTFAVTLETGNSYRDSIQRVLELSFGKEAIHGEEVLATLDRLFDQGPDEAFLFEYERRVALG